MRNLNITLRAPVTRPSIGKCISRAVDRMMTGTQEWLETKDRDIDKLVASLVVGATLVMLAGKLIGAAW